MTRNTKVVLVLFAVIVFGGIVSAWSIAGRGFSAKATPTVVETLIARNVRDFATPRSARDAQNPVTKSADVLRQAMAHYADHCAMCHANDGSGVTSIGQGLYPKPPDMRRAETQNLTDGELFYIIHNGIRLTGMPAFGQSAPDQDMDSWKLVHFIRRLPSLTDDELATMKALNPKSRHELEEEEAARRFLAGEDLPSDKHGHH